MSDKETTISIIENFKNKLIYKQKVQNARSLVCEERGCVRNPQY